MTANERFKRIDGLGESFLYVDSAQIESDIDYINQRRPSNLFLNARGEYKLRDLNWIEQVHKHIRWLMITSPAKGRFDYSGLRFCTELSRLLVNNFSPDPVDVSANTALERLNVLDGRFIAGVELLCSLESFVVAKAPPQMLVKGVFDNLKRLRELSISYTDLSEGLMFLRGSRLDTLWLFYCNKLSLLGLPELGVRRLRIQNCRKIDHSELLYKAQSLEQLSMTDSIRLGSARDLSALVNLKELILLGTSYFEDGDLEALKNRLCIFNYDDKRHYSVRFQEFKNSFLVR